jgi:branched-chain amino acid transport system permease protein
MRAVASNPDSSALVGIPVNRMLLLGWGLAAALGAVAGSFAAPDRGLDSNLMLIILVYAFAAVTLGGFDSLVGAVVGGLVVGVVTVVIPQYVTALANLPLVPAFVLIFLVLLVRPQGLFGSAEVSRV